jgi:hypothetical protein
VSEFDIRIPFQGPVFDPATSDDDIAPGRACDQPHGQPWVPTGKTLITFSLPKGQQNWSLSEMLKCLGGDNSGRNRARRRWSRKESPQKAKISVVGMATAATGSAPIESKISRVLEPLPGYRPLSIKG